MTRILVSAGLLATAALASGCFGRGAAQTVRTDEAAVAVDAATLWDPNAPKDPVVEYRLRLATEPDNAALHNNLGNLYVMRNWLEEATEEFERAIDLAPGSPVAWNNLGTAYMRMGKTSKARSSFEKAVKIDPTYALGWFNLGYLADHEGNFDEAIDMYLKAAAQDPKVLEYRENPLILSVDAKRLLTVRLRRYLEEESSLALPLEPMPE